MLYDCIYKMLEQTKLSSGDRHYNSVHPGAGEGERLKGIIRELSEVVVMFYILIGVLFIRVHTFVKLLPNVSLRSVHCTLYKLYFIKLIFSKRSYFILIIQVFPQLNLKIPQLAFVKKVQLESLISEISLSGAMGT